MSMEKSARPARVIVVGNEKGGSGKSTVAMHVAVALMKARQSVTTVDLDFRQRSLTHYVENRRMWGERIGRALDVPRHLCPDVLASDESEALHGLRRRHRCAVGKPRASLSSTPRAMTVR